MMDVDTKAKPDTTARKDWMGVLAKAPPARLATLFEEIGARHGFTWLRPPEVGGVMLRGRTGGTGAAFNLGEMSVTRSALQLDTGEVGHAHVQGRDKAQAERAALVDALMQTERAKDIRKTVSSRLWRNTRRRGPLDWPRRRPPKSISSPWFGGKTDA